MFWPFHEFTSMIGTALWNIFRNVKVQIFEEIKAFCFFKGITYYCKQNGFFLVSALGFYKSLIILTKFYSLFS